MKDKSTKTTPESTNIKLATTVVNTLKILQSLPMKKTYKSIVCYLLIFIYCNIVCIGMIGHIIKMYVSGNFSYDVISKDIAILLLGFSGYRYCLHVFGNSRLSLNLIDEMGDFSRYEKPPHIERVDSILNNLFKLLILTVICLTPILLWTLMTESCEDDDYECGFIYPTYIPGVMTPFRRRWFVVIQITSAWMYVLLGTGSVWLAMHMAEYIILYLKHCQTLTQTISVMTDFNKRRQQVRHVVRYHHRILFLYKKFVIIGKGIFVVHAISTPAIIACMIFSLRVEFQIQVFLIVAIWIAVVVIVCYMGQRMIDESDNLAEIIYDVIPFDGDLYTAKALLFMLTQSQRSLKVPAGDITYCGYNLLVAILKATYSYITLIESTTK